MSVFDFEEFEAEYREDFERGTPAERFLLADIVYFMPSRRETYGDITEKEMALLSRVQGMYRAEGDISDREMKDYEKTLEILKREIEKAEFHRMGKDAVKRFLDAITPVSSGRRK